MLADKDTTSMSADNANRVVVVNVVERCRLQYTAENFSFFSF